MTIVRSDVLDRAVAERLTAVMWVPGETDREWQVRLAANAQDGEGIWVQPLDDPDRVLDDFIAHGCEMKVALGFERKRYVFLTQILKRNKHHWLNQATMIEALLLRYPAEVGIEDRRAHPRLLVPDGTNVQAGIICGNAMLPLQVKPWDVSAGGISFLCPREQNVIGMKRGDRFSFTLGYRDRKIAGSALMCFSRMLSPKVVKIGVQFIQESMDDASHEGLDYLLSELSRLEALRGRGKR